MRFVLENRHQGKTGAFDGRNRRPENSEVTPPVKILAKNFQRVYNQIIHRRVLRFAGGVAGRKRFAKRRTSPATGNRPFGSGAARLDFHKPPKSERT